jgi:Uracil DNA glycosylase superfamily
MAEFDPGPTGAFATHWDNRPSYNSVKARFRMNWGPIYYRGRLDGSAKVIIIGQDPAADENVARRILVGSAGQRVQGFLRKLGLNKSYVMVNTFIYGLKGQIDAEAKTISASPSIKNWRNQLLDMLKTGQTQAVIAFGAGAQQVVDLWPGASGLFVAKPLHPSFRDDAGLRANWNTWLPQIRPHVTPEAAVDITPYAGNTFKKADLENIPPRDLPFGVPKWMGTGDMAWRTSPTQIAWKSLAADG